jgi:hypothetical protein
MMQIGRTQRQLSDSKNYAPNHFGKSQVDEGFFDQVQFVLPFFWKSSLPKTKTGIMVLLGTHLQLIDIIADKKVGNSITTTDLSRLNRVEILAEFIKLDKATSLSNAQTAVQKGHQAIAALLASCDNEMDAYYVHPPDSNADDLDMDDDSDDDSDYES